jgi:hypothetical protein
MADPILEANQAESWQSIKALLIPLSLFLACLIAAAGTFLIYNHEPVGWVFLATALVIIVADFVGLIRFQNKFRARGIIPDEATVETNAAKWNQEPRSSTAQEMP